MSRDFPPRLSGVMKENPKVTTVKWREVRHIAQEG